jgi:D-amino-acid oxidase
VGHISGNLGQVDCIVVGAGVVGLACARAIAQTGREVLVLEAESRIGEHCSGRNSEVIHAGIYYPAGSLKARLCVAGRDLLYAYLNSRGVDHRQLGKLIVATSEAEVSALEQVQRHALANGVSDLEALEKNALHRLEPALRAEAGLYSPATGIVDSHAFMLSLQGELESAGGMVVFRSAVTKVWSDEDGFLLQLASGDDTIGCRWLVNSAGLGAWEVARAMEAYPNNKLPPRYYARGHYMTYSGKAPFSRLIYPLPEAGGLGIHLTLDIAGGARFGPDVQWVEEPVYRFDQDLSEKFATAIRAYWPGLEAERLQPGYAGVRPKIVGPGEPQADFMIQHQADHGVAGAIHLFGIESPGLTASLAIGDHVLQLLEQ